MSGVFYSKVRAVEEFPIGPDVRSIELSGYNGSIVWEPLNGQAPRVVAEKEVQGMSEKAVEKLLEEMRIENSSSGQSLVLRAVHPKRTIGWFTLQVRFTVFAPAEQIKEFRARTSNGSIRVKTPVEGVLDLASSNGQINLGEVVGQVNAQTSNARLNFAKLILTRPSTLITSNAGIEGQLELAGEGLYRIVTSNAGIRLRLPHSTRGSLQAATSNGRVEAMLGEHQQVGGNTVVIKRGEGPHLEVKTSNSSISLLGY